MTAPMIDRVIGGQIGQLGHGQQRDDRQHRDHRDVLKQQHREARLPSIGFHQPLFAQRLQNDRGRAHGQDHPDRQRHGPRLPQQHRHPHHRQRGASDLQAAQPQKPRAHLPQQARFKLQPHKEQHHHHAELGNMLDRDHIGPQPTQQRPQRDARNQIAQYRPQSQPRGDGHHGHTGNQEQETQQQDTIHHTASPPQSTVRSPARTTSCWAAVSKS